MAKEKKVIKLIRMFKDGSQEYLDGEDLKHFIDLQTITESHVFWTHGIEIKWKERKGSPDKHT